MKHALTFFVALAALTTSPSSNADPAPFVFPPFPVPFALPTPPAVAASPIAAGTETYTGNPSEPGAALSFHRISAMPDGFVAAGDVYRGNVWAGTRIQGRNSFPNPVITRVSGGRVLWQRVGLSTPSASYRGLATSTGGAIVAVATFNALGLNGSLQLGGEAPLKTAGNDGRNQTIVAGISPATGDVLWRTLFGYAPAPALSSLAAVEVDALRASPDGTFQFVAHLKAGTTGMPMSGAITPSVGPPVPLVGVGNEVFLGRLHPANGAILSLVKLEAAPADHVEVAISDTRVWVLGSSWEAGGVRIDAFDTNGRRVAPPTHLGMGTGPLQQQLDTATSGTARRALLAIAHASGELTFVQRSAQGEGFARALVHLDSMGRPTATTPLSPLLGPWALEALICLVGENASGQVFLAASPPTSYTHPRIYTVDPRTGATTGQADAPLVSPVGDGFVSDTRITVVGDGVAAVARVLQPSPVPAFALPPPPAIPPFALPLPTSVSPGGPF